MINTLDHLAFVLKVEKQEIKTIIANIDKFYYEKEKIKISKQGKIKRRVLNPSIRRLKVIQKRIQKNIFNELQLPDYAYGAVSGRDNVMNARKHQGKKFNFTTDLKKFFPSINHKKVFEMYISFKFSPTIARLLTQLTTYKGKLPQGAPTSPTISNLVFIKTGKKLHQFAIENKLTFTSFIDDLTFSAPTDFKEKAHFIIDIIQADGFRISHDKTSYKTKNPLVTGIVVRNNNLALPDSYKIKLQNLDGKTEEQKRGLQLYANKVLNPHTKQKYTLQKT